MTDITELAQSLKAAAGKLDGANWQTRKGFSGIEVIVKGSLEKRSGFTSFQPVAADLADSKTAKAIALFSPANILALVEALEAKDAEAEWMRKRIAGLGKELEVSEERRVKWFQMAQELGEKLDAAEKRIAELESQVKFPGVMRCNTCGFSRSHVIVTPGGMLAGESEPEHCPNGCGPLWHDTYRRQYNELYDAYKELESRTVTVKLPDLRQIVSGDRYVWSDGVYNYSQDVKAALTAAGIKVEAE